MRKAFEKNRSAAAPGAAGEAGRATRAICSAFLERLEVVPHLTAVVERDGLLRQSLLHHLAVLRHDAHRRQPGGVLRPLAQHVRVVGLPAALPHLSLDTDVERILAEAVRGITPPAGIRALPGQGPLSLAEVRLVLPPPAGAPLAVTAAPAVTPALEPLAAALTLLLRPHLLESPLHRLHRLRHLPLIQRLGALHHVLAPVTLAAATAPRAPSHPVHLVEELPQLLRRHLARVHAREEAPRLAEHHLVLALCEVSLELGQAVDALEEPNAVIALLQEAREIRPLRGHVRVLEGSGQVALGVLPVLGVGPGLVVPVVHLHPLDLLGPLRGGALDGLLGAGSLGLL